MVHRDSSSALLIARVVEESIESGSRHIKLSFGASMHSFQVLSDTHRTRGYELSMSLNTPIVMQAIKEDIAEVIFLLLLPHPDVSCIVCVDDQVILGLMPDPARSLSSIPLLFPSNVLGSPKWMLDVTSVSSAGSIGFKAFVQKSHSLQLLYVNKVAAANEEISSLVQRYGHIGYLILITCPPESCKIEREGPRGVADVLFTCQEAEAFLVSHLEQMLLSFGIPRVTRRHKLHDPKTQTLGLATSIPGSQRVSLQVSENIQERYAAKPSGESSSRNAAGDQVIQIIDLGVFSKNHQSFEESQKGSFGPPRLSPYFGPDVYLPHLRDRITKLLPRPSTPRHKLCPLPIEVRPSSLMPSSSSTTVVGQMDRKFIVLANKDAHSSLLSISIVDQHAASERLQLDDLMSKIMLCLPTRNGTYLHPAVLDSLKLHQPVAGRFTPAEAESWSDETTRESCERWGWRLSPDGDLTHVPTLFRRGLGIEDLKAYLREQREGFRGAIPTGALEILKSKACRSAIMFGDILSIDQSYTIVRELANSKLWYQCAHGRPTVSSINV